MSDFKHKFTQVLGLISQAKKEQLLTDEERKKIKEHIISEEPDLTTEMEKYNKDKDLSGLVETLKLLAGITAMSSPLDNSLFQKKRDQQHKKKKKNDDKINLDSNNINIKQIEYARNFATKIIDMTKKQVVERQNDFLKKIFKLPVFKNLFSKIYYVKVYSYYLEGKYKECLDEYYQYNKYIK